MAVTYELRVSFEGKNVSQVEFAEKIELKMKFKCSKCCFTRSGFSSMWRNISFGSGDNAVNLKLNCQGTCKKLPGSVKLKSFQYVKLNKYTKGKFLAIVSLVCENLEPVDFLAPATWLCQVVGEPNPVALAHTSRVDGSLDGLAPQLIYLGHEIKLALNQAV